MRIAWSTALACLLIAPRAHGDTPRIWLEYHAGSGCPGRDEFVAALRARTDRFELADTPADATTYRVTLLGDAEVREGLRPSLSVGRLEILQQDGSVASRELRGDTCRNVADGIALVLTLGLDPNATTAPVTPPPLARAADSRAPYATEPADPRALPRAPASPGPASPAHAASLWSSRSRPGWRLFVAAGVDASGGIAARIPLSPALIVETNLPRERPRDGLDFTLGLRFSGTTASSGTQGVSSESASFRWTAARLDVCPVEIVVGPVDAWACARGEGGALYAAGSGIQAPQTRLRPWFAAGAVARVGIVIVGPVFLEVETALTIPLFRDHFFFDNPEDTVYDVPIVAGAAGGALGIRFL